MIPGISAEFGLYFSAEGGCNTFEVGFYRAGSVGFGLDLAAGFGVDQSFGRPENVYEGYYLEGEGSVGPVNGNVFFSPNAGSGAGGGYGASLEASPFRLGACIRRKVKDSKEMEF